MLQREDPYIYLIHDARNRFLTHSAGRFVPVRTIKSADHLSTINLENHKHPEDMYLGLLTNSTLNKLFQNGTISDSQKENFFAGGHTFHERSFECGREKLPIDYPAYFFFDQCL